MAGCSCGGDCIKLVYACSGAANTGYLADAVSRKLKAQGLAGMTCLAAVGADLSGFLETAKSVDKNIIIDGCPVACGKRIFEKNGLEFEHYITTDYGVVKNKTVITNEVIDRVTEEIGNKI